MKLLNLLNKNILNEVSEKVKNQLYSKFKDDTSDSREMVMSNIDLFDRYKESLPSKGFAGLKECRHPSDAWLHGRIGQYFTRLHHFRATRGSLRLVNLLRPSGR